MYLLRSYLDVMPRLMGEESFHDSTVVAMGSGTLKKEVRDRINREWRRHVSDSVVKLTPEQKRMAAAGVGIKVN